MTDYSEADFTPVRDYDRDPIMMRRGERVVLQLEDGPRVAILWPWPKRPSPTTKVYVHVEGRWNLGTYRRPRARGGEMSMIQLEAADPGEPQA